MKLMEIFEDLYGLKTLAKGLPIRQGIFLFRTQTGTAVLNDSSLPLTIIDRNLKDDFAGEWNLIGTRFLTLVYSTKYADITDIESLFSLRIDSTGGHKETFRLAGAVRTAITDYAVAIDGAAALTTTEGYAVKGDWYKFYYPIHIASTGFACKLITDPVAFTPSANTKIEVLIDGIAFPNTYALPKGLDLMNLTKKDLQEFIRTRIFLHKA